MKRLNCQKCYCLNRRLLNHSHQVCKEKFAQDTALVVRSATASKALIKAQTEVAHTALTETALLVADVETLSHFSPDKQKYFEYILNEYTACVAQRIRMLEVSNMLYILFAICFVYTVYKVACWLMDWLDSKAETEVKPAEPTFTPEEILQTKVILTR